MHCAVCRDIQKTVGYSLFTVEGDSEYRMHCEGDSENSRMSRSIVQEDLEYSWMCIVQCAWIFRKPWDVHCAGGFRIQ